MNELGAWTAHYAVGAECCALPSGQHACSMWKGEPEGWFVPLDVLMRAGLITGGIYLSGERDTGRLVRHAVAGSLAVEAFVLLWSTFRK